MRIDRLSGWTALVALGWLSAASAFAQDGPLAIPWRADFETTGEEFEPITADGEVAAVPETCLTFGAFTDLNAGRNRYRGNVYQIEEGGVELHEILMEFRFRGTVGLHFSIHRTVCGSGGAYLRVRPDIVVTAAGATNPNGTPKPTFYTTGRLSPPVMLERGYCYAIGASWTETNSTSSRDVTYGRDQLRYPAPFLHGQVLGPVTVNAAPPLDDDLGVLFVFTDGVYSQRFCFASVEGACCCGDIPDRGCEDRLATNCTGPGCHFFGERVGCNEVVCDFGACCFPCGECGDDYVAEACTAEGGAKHWSGADCLADPELPDALCPEITGACCQGDVCEELCVDDCLDAGGVYRGDGTTCEPNICVGACCLDGACMELTSGFCAWLGAEYRGDGTECATLSSGQECGGACCYQIGTLKGCQNVEYRAECTIAAGVSKPTYVGAGTSCLNEPCSHLGSCSGDPDIRCGTDHDCLGFCSEDVYERCVMDQNCIDAGAGAHCIGSAGGTCNLPVLGACCLPNGTCLFTTAAVCVAEVPGGGDFAPDDGRGTAMCQTPCATRGCCFRDGTCQALMASACEDMGGEPDRGHATCTGVDCGAFRPVGACCGVNPGVCEEISEFDCVQQDGVYLGDNTTCSDPPEDACPGFGACCRDGGDCFDQVTEAECVSVKLGRYQEDGSVCDEVVEFCDLRGACCAETGRCLFVLEAECLDMTGLAEAFQGVGVLCGQDTCPTGACCIGGDCEIRGEVFCRGAGRVYQGDDTTCALDLCPIRACCFDDGSCIDFVASECRAAQGTFQIDVTCDADPCEPVGACCKRDGNCLNDVTESDCASIGGRLTPAATCTGIPPCPVLGACCYRDGTCGDSVKQTDCAAARGLFTPVAYCDALTTCKPRGACCKTGVCYEDKTAAECEFLGGVFQGGTVDCLPGMCTLGACCHLDGTCKDNAVRSECPGEYDEFSEGMACVNVCVARGACCLDEGGVSVCRLLTFNECFFNFDGTYDGNGKTCREALCEPVTCCTEDEVCLWGLTRQVCEQHQGTYMGPDFTCDGRDDPACTRGVCCAPDGTCTANKIQIECNDPDDFLPSASCTQCKPRGACCLPEDPGGEYCQIMRRDDCLVDPTGTYAGDATVCLPGDDLCVYGACCMPMGVCETRTRQRCEAADGIYYGAETDCADFECVLAACCMPNETCTPRTQPHCEAANGVYQGAGASCSPADCLRGACCTMDGTCVDHAVASQCAEPYAVFEPGMDCGEFTCPPRGACCEGLACNVRTHAQCGLAGGTYAGTGVLCEPSPCRPTHIIGSSPPNCTIDARQPSKPDGTSPAGWDAIDLTFDANATGLTPGNFTVRVEPGPATVPVITAVVATAAAETITLELDGPIPTGKWTCVTYDYSGDEVCIGHLPGDVNGDRTAAPADILRVIDCLNAVSFCGIHQCDVDRSNLCGPPDILRVIDLLNGAGAYDPWLNVRLPVCPSAP